MIFDHFKISGTSEALPDFNDLSRVQLTGDQVHGFDTKWDEVLPPMTEVPDDVLESCTKTAPKLRGIETSHGSKIRCSKENLPIMLD